MSDLQELQDVCSSITQTSLNYESICDAPTDEHKQAQDLSRWMDIHLDILQTKPTEGATKHDLLDACVRANQEFNLLRHYRREFVLDHPSKDESREFLRNETRKLCQEQADVAWKKQQELDALNQERWSLEARRAQLVQENSALFAPIYRDRTPTVAATVPATDELGLENMQLRNLIDCLLADNAELEGVLD